MSLFFIFRLKKVQGKKKRDKAVENPKVPEETDQPTAFDDETQGPGDLLSSKDDDVIF
jgi:V-type H+-transporting ATPase subunit D